MGNSDTKLLIFTAPSGAGKTTIVRHLLDKYDKLAFSVSATTREMRSYEKDGVDYYFLTEEDFKKKMEAKEFAEWEEVYAGQYYGTLKSEIDRLIAAGKYIIFDIDVQGALRLKKNYGDRCLTVFVQPPGLEALIIRLKKRNTETLATLKKRVDKASKELAFADRFDIILINDDLESALKNAEDIANSFLNK